MELEAKHPVTPPKECEARVTELKGYVFTIELHLAETQKLLDDTNSTSKTMGDLDDLVKVRATLQKNKKELDEVAAVMKDLALL